MSKEAEVSGWDAIEHEMQRIYGDQEPKHYGTLISYALGGPDPLDGISAYKSNASTPHWHFVTYGFSELYDKKSEDSNISGYGFELTFRLARKEGEEEPPGWALNLLQNMGRYVFNSGNVFLSGDYLDANGPICLDADTQLTALAFVKDPQLSAIETPNGRVEFLQMVGITADELEAMQTWTTLGVLHSGSGYIPYYITDLERDSLLQIPAVAEMVQHGTERDGSNTGFLFVDQLEFTPGKKSLFSKSPAVLHIGAKQAGIVGKLLRGRTLKGKDLTLSTSNFRAIIQPGDSAGYEADEEKIRISLNDQAAEELSSKLVAREGAIQLTAIKGLTVQIVKTHIKDQEGNVVETIG